MRNKLKSQISERLNLMWEKIDPNSDFKRLFKVRVVTLPPFDANPDFKDAVDSFKAKLTERPSSLFRDPVIRVRHLQAFSKNCIDKIANDEDLNLADMVDQIMDEHKITKI